MSIWNRDKAKVHIADQILDIFIDQTNHEERLKVLEDKVAKIERQNGK